MKKILLILCVAILTICGNIASVFADAAAYDMEPVDFYVYVATPDGGLNMRHGPGTEYGKVTESKIPDGVQLHITLTSGHWGYTSYNGNYGWVTLKQTTQKSTPVSTVQPATPTPVPTAQPQQTLNPPTSEPENTEEPNTEPESTTEPDTESEYDNVEEEMTAKKALSSEFLLVAILVLSIVLIALLLIMIINLKSRK